MRIVLVVIAAAISVVLTEVLTMTWLQMAPVNLDLLGNYFLSVVLPVVLFVHLAITLVFWKAFEPQPVREPAIYVCTHALLQAIGLGVFGNPPATIASYVVIILLSGFAVTGVFRRYFWCLACTRLGID
jgi:hypothetical protein